MSYFLVLMSTFQPLTYCWSVYFHSNKPCPVVLTKWYSQLFRDLIECDELENYFFHNFNIAYLKNKIMICMHVNRVSHIHIAHIHVVNKYALEHIYL